MNILSRAGKLIKRATGVDLSGANSMFGSLGKRMVPVPANADFVPVDGEGGTMSLTGDMDIKPVWLGLDIPMMQFWAYKFCSPLSAVIDRLAEADSNGKIEYIDENGATLKNYKRREDLKRVMRLMKKPNPKQTWKEFNAEQVVFCKIFGYCVVLPICPAGFDKTYTKAFYNVNPLLSRPIRSFDVDLYSTDISKASQISGWDLTVGSTRYTKSADEVILIKDGFIDIGNNDLPISKIVGLDFFVSNICAAMEADNVLLKKKGPLGVFSHDPKPDMAGWLPLTNEQKDDLQKDLSRYGLTIGQLQYVISKTPLKWNAMSFNLRDLMTKETTRQGIDGICDRLGYPAELMSGKNATYENRDSAEKYLYQNNVIPFSLRRIDVYNQYFGFEDVQLTFDYDHLPVLQEDALKSSQAYKSKAEGLDISWKAGMITWNECRIAQGQDTVQGMDIYYSEWLKNNPESQQQVQKTVKDETTPKDK